MSKPFTNKRIRIKIALRAGKFDDGNDVVIIDDLPMHVEIIKAGIPTFPEANITIWGMKLDKMRALSMKGHVAFQSYRNRVEIYAGDGDPDQLPLVFSGEESFGTMRVDESGNAFFEMKAFTGIYAAMTPSKPQSVIGSVPASDLMQMFAEESGFSFVNQGVTTQVTDCVIQGDPMTKMRTLSDAIGATFLVDDKTIVFLPSKDSRKGPNITINKYNGLIGYPNITSTGISFTCLFRPEILFNQSVTVESTIPMASGNFRILKIHHVLDANQNEGGAWFSTFESWFNYGL